MKYRFKKLDLWEELKAAVGDIPCTVTDSGDETLFDFGDVELSPTEEESLIRLMAEKSMLRGRQSKFEGKGLDMEITP